MGAFLPCGAFIGLPLIPAGVLGLFCRVAAIVQGRGVRRIPLSLASDTAAVVEVDFPWTQPSLAKQIAPTHFPNDIFFLRRGLLPEGGSLPDDAFLVLSQLHRITKHH